MQPIGIMSALHEEISDLLGQMDSVTTRRIGMRDYHEGLLHGQPCVAVLARVGKVAAAATAVTLIREFDVQAVVFTGLAGGLAPHVRVGDVVVATSLMQHDLDASPLFPQYEIPLTGLDRFHADPQLSRIVHDSVQGYLEQDWPQEISETTRQSFSLSAPRIHTGLIVSGDQFINGSSEVLALREALPDALCVEMEGAAVAQICYEYGAPVAVVRTISDRADDTAEHDFSGFLSAVASRYSAGILRRVLHHPQVHRLRQP